MTIRTFSGAHPFRPACLVAVWQESMRYEYGDPTYSHDDAVDFVAALIPAIDNGRCPRCDTALADHEIPSGSRMTDCRCIPICTLCGKIEAIVMADLVNVHGPEDAALTPLLSCVADWPVDRSEQQAGMDEYRVRHVRPLGTLVRDDDSQLFVITESGVATLSMRESPGGWLEHGFDDSEDRAERER